MIGFTVLALAILATPAESTSATASYSMTIYAEDALPNGHVFFSLTDGASTTTQGFYPERRGPGAPAGRNGGVVRDDSHTRWTVRKRYALSADEYARARNAMARFAAQKHAWCLPGRHCGDYTEEIARAAGVALDLPWTATGRNRPGIVTAYLQTHGGEPNPAYRPPAESWFFTLRASSARLAAGIERRARLAAKRADDTSHLLKIKEAFDREYGPKYAAYAAYCKVTLEPDEAVKRQAQCDLTWDGLEAIRLRYAALQKPYEDDRNTLDTALAALDASMAAERGAIRDAYAQLAAAPLVSAGCARSDEVAIAACALEQRGRMH